MKRGSTAPQHSQQGGKATRPSHEATRYPEGGTSKTNYWPGRHTKTTDGGREGGDHNDHNHTTESPSAEGEAHRKHRDEPGRAKANKKTKKDKQRRHTQTDPSKKPTTKQPRGEESTATKGRQSGGGTNKKGHATRSHTAARPVRAEDQPVPRGSKARGTKQIKKGVKQGQAQARRGKRQRGGNRYVILRVVYSR